MKSKDKKMVAKALTVVTNNVLEPVRGSLRFLQWL